MIKPILTNREKVSVVCDPAPEEELQQVVQDLLDTAEKFSKHCSGLAAPQIGYPYAVFVIKVNNKFVPIVCPTYVRKWGGRRAAVEISLSRPGVRVKVLRYVHVKIQYYDMESKTVITRQFNNVQARVVQHEVDYLYGVTI